MTWTFVDRTDPAPSRGVPFPTDWLAGWMRETHAHGRRRLGAVAAFHEQLCTFGATGSALVGGGWMADDDQREGVWRRGPFKLRRSDPDADRLWAEGAGEVPMRWLRPVLTRYLADSDRRDPPLAPRIWRIEGGDPPGLLIDLSTAGRRSGVVLVCLSEEAMPLAETLLAAPVLRWAVPVVAGLLRSEQFRVHWDTLSRVLVGHDSVHWDSMDGDQRPVNAQEVMHRAAAVAASYAEDAAAAFEVATAGVFLPDPEDEYVFCVGAAGADRYAYDAGVVPRKPAQPGVEFGLTPSYVVGAAWDPAGGPVVVRDLPDRAAMKTRYRDLGFEAGSLDGASASPPPMSGERFIHGPVRDAALDGPWVFTAQRLPRALSATGRNLVLRFQGRITSTLWAGREELHRTSRDRRIRMASLAQRIHADLVALLDRGLGIWRDGLREEVLRELSTQQNWSSLCQTLASWLSCRSVSLFRFDGASLSLLAWSLPHRPPALRFDPADALLDSAELRLLQAPLHPKRDRVSSEGFLGWPQLEDALGARSENVGTAPVMASGQVVGLLRVDGVMSLYGGLLRRSSPQGGLHHHRPMSTPAHARPVLEEVARLLAPVLGGRGPSASPWSGWTGWVERARHGQVGTDEVLQRLDDLRAEARSRAAAAQVVGVHRNTFRRQLQVLAEVLEVDRIWW
jgi:hypothetical protein